jgi:surface antigen
LQQGNIQQAPVQPQAGGRQGGPAQNGVQQGNNRGNNFDQRDNGQYGNSNARFGNNGNNYGPYGSNSGRNFDRDEFNRRYYGRYGSDPNNFQRNRQAYRVAQRWQERYPHDYVYADDSFYRDCRSNNEVGGAIVGAILGGILGNAVSHGQGGATLAGVILGGVGGASLAGNLDCEDRSYVYPVYYDGFERGRSRASYSWRNERNGNYGTLLVGDYYQDRDNYRCATYTQTIYVRGTPQVARGHACRQDDGTWALVD